MEGAGIVGALRALTLARRKTIEESLETTEERASA
jgi:hypothetical protein